MNYPIVKIAFSFLGQDHLDELIFTHFVVAILFETSKVLLEFRVIASGRRQDVVCNAAPWILILFESWDDFVENGLFFA